MAATTVTTTATTTTTLAVTTTAGRRCGTVRRSKRATVRALQAARDRFEALVDDRTLR